MFKRLLMASLVAAAMAYAQDGMGGMGGGSGRPGRGGDMGAMPPGAGMQRQRTPSKPEQMADKLKLNKEQKDQLETILSAAREKAGPVRQQMDKQRAAIATAFIQGKSGDDVDKLLADYTAIASQMTSVETEAFGKIYAMLKPNQQGKAGQAFELMAGMFTQQSRGGQGRGRGEGR
jgi:Spy/CpxP family protein refolding chaperone